MLAKCALLLFPLLMAFAASSDLLTMRISNRVVLLLVAIFCAVAVGIGMPLDEFGLHVACATIVLIVAFAMFAFGWIGGGDAKLAAATTFWLGFGVTLPYLLYASLIGGAMTLALLMVRRWPLPIFLLKIDWVHRLHDRKSGVPYGIALAAAGLITYSDTLVFHRLAG
jgi:prepilin peptidase CpaA